MVKEAAFPVTIDVTPLFKASGRNQEAPSDAESRGGNVTRLSKTSAPARLAIYLPKGIRISTRRTLLSGGFCHDARDGALPGDAGRLIRTESLD